MSAFKINNIDVAPPVQCDWSYADLSSDESGRSTRTGAMSKDIIAQKHTLNLTWGYLTFAEASKIAQLCKKKGAALYLTYPDVIVGKYVTGRFYTGDLSGGYNVFKDDEIYVMNMTCSFIEM